MTICAQPAQSPDLSIIDPGFFEYLKSRVWRELFGKIDDRFEGVQRLVGEIDAETLEGNLLRRYSQVLAGLGENGFEVDHKRKKIENAAAGGQFSQIGKWG